MRNYAFFLVPSPIKFSSHTSARAGGGFFFHTVTAGEFCSNIRRSPKPSDLFFPPLESSRPKTGVTNSPLTCDSRGTLRHEHRTCDCVSSHSHCGVSHKLWAPAALVVSVSTSAAAAAAASVHRNGVMVRRRRPSVVPAAAGHRRSAISGPPSRVRRPPF